MRLGRQLVIALLVLVGIAASGAEAGAAAADDPVVIVFVRHAETAGSTRGGGDPPLSEAGRARAAALARALADSDATHLFASEALRARETLAPLAAARKLETTTIPAGETDRQVAALRALRPGSVAVVAGHTNTVPKLVGALGGEVGGLVDDPQYGRLIPHEDYGRMVVVVLGQDGAGVTTVELRYGEDPPASTPGEAAR